LLQRGKWPQSTDHRQDEGADGARGRPADDLSETGGHAAGGLASYRLRQHETALSTRDASAVIAFRQFSLADIWRGHVSSWAQLHRPTLTMRGEQAIPRLIVQSSRGPAGEPIPLGLTIHGSAEGAVVIITGLLPGMELTNGIEVDVGRWEVSATDVRYAWITPPDGFVGSAAPTAELRLPDDSIAYRQAMHLEWVPSSPPGFAENQYHREEAAGPTPPVLAGERDLEKAAAIPSSPSLAPEQLDRQDATVSSGPPVLAGERDLEKAAAIPSSPSLAPEQPDRQDATVSSSPSPAAAPLAGRRKRGRDGPMAPTASDVGTSGQKPFFPKEMPAQAEVIRAPFSYAPTDTRLQAGSNKAQSPFCLASAAEVRQLTPNAWPRWTYGPNGERCWYSGEKPVFAGKR